jgi:hypothetical protein
VALLLLAGLLLIIGGGRSGPTVVGTVKVDGDLLAKGTISCVPVDDQGALAEGRGPGGGDTIRDGKYRIDKGLTAGRYQVEIQGTRIVPGELMTDQIMSNQKIPKLESVVHVTQIKEVAPGFNTIDFLDLKGIRSKGTKAGKSADTNTPWSKRPPP